MSVHVRIWRDWTDDAPAWEGLLEHVRIKLGDGRYYMRSQGHVIEIYLGPVVVEEPESLLTQKGDSAT